MLTTGLLSLNVHEALTFEGTEICLHPDLFGPIASSSSGRHPAASSSNPAVVNSRRLEIGDLIEIRIWDTISTGRRSNRNRIPLARKNSNSTRRHSAAGSNNDNNRESSSPQINKANSGSLKRSESFPKESLSNNNLHVGESGNITTTNNNNLDSSAADAEVARNKEGDSPIQSTNIKTVISNNNLVAPHLEEASQLLLPSLSRSSSSKASHIRDDSDMTVDSSVAMSINRSNLTPTTEEDILNKISETHGLRLSFVMLVNEKTLTSLKGPARTQVSLLRQVADLYNLSSYDMVSISRIGKEYEKSVLEAISADFVVVTIKDQFISRGDMHLFQKSLIGSWIYEGERLSETTRGLKAHAREIHHGKMLVKSGVITEDTMVTYRSRSSRIFWLVQISAEMWDYASPYQRGKCNGDETICEIYFDKLVSFVRRLFANWKIAEVTHSLTVVFFSRTFLGSKQTRSLDCKDVYGRRFEDRYKVVIEDETRTDWDSLVIRIKEAFVTYPIEVGWNLANAEYGRRPSNASQGNVLEAINVTLNLLQFHYLDRDLHRTGNSIVVISPGCGVFEVDKGLAGITYQRMMDHGIGSDMLSLGLPPLHIAPFFLYNNDYRTVESRGVDTSETYYEVPHWMHLSFINYDGVSNDDKGNTTYDTDLPIVFFNDEFNVAANGFLLQKPSDQSHPSPINSPGERSYSFSPSSISFIGNANNSADKSRMARERQLIAGRDFQDILEACRPRSVGALPSALKALLRMHRHIEKIDKAKARVKAKAELRAELKAELDSTDDEVALQTDELMPLREWGSVDFRHDHNNRLLRSVQRPSGYVSMEHLSPHLGPSDPSDKIEFPDSPASSYTSQRSTMSFDRSVIGRSTGIYPAGEMQLQRSTSQGLLALETADSETIRSEESMSTTGVDVSVDGTTEEDFPIYRKARRDRDKLTDDLKKIIKEHDSNYFNRVSEKANTISEAVLCRQQQSHTDTSVTLSPGLPPQKRISIIRGGENTQLGGIGAALSQHDVFNIGSQAETPRIINPTVLSSFSHAFQPLPIFPDLGNRAMSPLLLPPSRVALLSDPSNEVPRQQDEVVKIPKLLQLDHRKILTRDARDVYAPRAFASFNSRVTSGGSTHKLSSKDPVEIRALKIRESNTTSSSSTRILPGMTAHGVNTSFISNAGTDATDFIRLERRKSETSVQRAARRGVTPPRGSGRKSERNINRSSGGSDISVGRSRSSRTRRKKVFNPFRQEDEDKVLKKRSHNRRRWSHVFPAGEVEFKRHAGPSWDSLTFPAILPLSVDYFPSRQEREHAYQWNIYNVTLSDFEETYYSTHADLLLEMVRLRLVQDYQLVPHSCVKSNERSSRVARSRHYKGRRHSAIAQHNPPIDRKDNTQNESGKEIKHYMTMGHRLQILTYDPDLETIEVIRYDEKTAYNDARNVFKYNYLVYCPHTRKYTKVVQTFKKYADMYTWNKIDRIICGGDGIEDKTLREGMRSRRLIFALIPPERFQHESEAEKEYISKFQRLSEYLSKISSKSREIDDSSPGLDITIVSSNSPVEDRQEDLSDMTGGRITMGDSMVRSAIQMRKGRDSFEWIELGVDRTFDTTRTFHIMYNWLVASSGKVETQVQLLHRRCTQFGLNLVFFSEKCASRNLFLNPYHAPITFCIRDKKKAEPIYNALLEMDYVNDGILYSETRSIQQCIENSNDYDEYDFGKRMTTKSRQFVHRSGAHFVRIIRDRQGWAILVVIVNPRDQSKDNESELSISELQQYLSSIGCYYKDS